MVVIRDFNPVRLAIRLRILADTNIANNVGRNPAFQQLREHERRAFELYDAEIRRVTGDKTIIWNVIDGTLRPEAKLDTLTKRAQAHAKRLKKEKTLPSGIKKSQLAGRPPASDDWWQNCGVSTKDSCPRPFGIGLTIPLCRTRRTSGPDTSSPPTRRIA